MLQLAHVFTITADVGEPVEVGATALGERRIIPIGGGLVEGPRLTGHVLPGGADYQLVHDAGLATIHARYVIETDAGARIYIENTGIRRGPPDLIARLRRGETVDPSLIYFRTIPRFETASAEFQWLMRSIFVARGTRHPNGVVIEVFEVH